MFEQASTWRAIRGQCPGERTRAGRAPRRPTTAAVGGGDVNRTYPTPSEMLLKIGVTILVALCVGLAGECLFNALTH